MKDSSILISAGEILSFILSKIKVSRKSLLGLIETLYSGIKKLNLGKVETEWGDYYSKTNYSEKQCKSFFF